WRAGHRGLPVQRSRESASDPTGHRAVRCRDPPKRSLSHQPHEFACDTPVHLREPWRCRFYRRGVDLSGIIFVVLAVAWAVYLIPKALRHHDEVARTRSIDRFSTAMRVLARREPVNRRDARLVVSPARAAGNPR